METVPQDYERIEDVMSNFDHEISEDIKEKLMSGKFYSGYPALDFYGSVWFDSGKLKCQIKQYGVHIDTIVADSLEDIMEEASDKYGRR